MEQLQTKRGLHNFNLCSLLAGIIIARLSCTALSNIPILTIGFVLIYALVFIVLMIISVRIITKKEANALLFLLVYSFEVMLSCWIAEISLFSTHAFNAYIMIILFFLYMYIKRLPRESQKRYFVLVLLGFTFTFIYSIIKLVENPMLSRMAATGRDYVETEDTLSAVGGFDTVYGSLLIFIVLVYIWQFVNGKKGKMLLSLAIASCVIFIIMATYAIAMVLLVITLAIILFHRSKWGAILVIIALLLTVIFHESIGDYIMQLSQTIDYSSIFKEKMHQIGHILRYGELVGTLSGDKGRLASMSWSFEAFAKYPVFGAFSYRSIRIGSHSEIIDTLGRFGITGFLSLGMFFILLFRDISSGITTKSGKKMLFTSITIYLSIALLDPALYTQQLLPIFLLIPFAENYTSSQRAIDDNNRISTQQYPKEIITNN